jgi:hypothetical protein
MRQIPAPHHSSRVACDVVWYIIFVPSSHDKPTSPKKSAIKQSAKASYTARSTRAPFPPIKQQLGLNKTLIELPEPRCMVLCRAVKQLAYGP